MDFLIAAHGVHQRGLVAGEARRIEDDQVILGFRMFEEIEDIVFEDFDFHAIQLRIFPRGGTCAGRNIDGGDLGRARLGTSQREAALVGEAVEDAFAPGQRGDLGVRLELVEVEPGFLTVEQVDLENQPVCLDLKCAGVLAVEHLDAGLHALGLAVG